MNYPVDSASLPTPWETYMQKYGREEYDPTSTKAYRLVMTIQNTTFSVPLSKEYALDLLLAIPPLEVRDRGFGLRSHYYEEALITETDVAIAEAAQRHLQSIGYRPVKKEAQ